MGMECNINLLLMLFNFYKSHEIVYVTISEKIEDEDTYFCRVLKIYVLTHKKVMPYIDGASKQHYVQ